LLSATTWRITSSEEKGGERRTQIPIRTLEPIFESNSQLATQ
jgi:hypothetical protein